MVVVEVVLSEGGVVLGVVVVVLVEPGVVVLGVVVVVLLEPGVVVVVELVVELPLPVRALSQPVTAAVASARTATTGMSFFMTSPIFRTPLRK